MKFVILALGLFLAACSTQQKVTPRLPAGASKYFDMDAKDTLYFKSKGNLVGCNLEAKPAMCKMKSTVGNKTRDIYACEMGNEIQNEAILKMFRYAASDQGKKEFFEAEGILSTSASVVQNNCVFGVTLILEP